MKKILFILIALITISSCFGQALTTPKQNLNYSIDVKGDARVKEDLQVREGVVVGDTTKNGNASLELVGTTKGFLPNRLTTAQQNAIVAPANGLTIYNIDSNAFVRYDSADGWRQYSTGSSGWSLTGNSGTTSANFLGTRSNQPLIFRQNDSLCGLIDASFNTSLGIIGLNSITSGTDNSAFGVGTLSSVTTGSFNTAVGSGSLNSVVNGNYNTAVGGALINVTSGVENTGIGENVGGTLITGRDNVLMGANADVILSTTSQAIAIGHNATADTFGIAFGHDAHAKGYGIYLGEGVTATGADTADRHQLRISNQIFNIKMPLNNGADNSVLTFNSADSTANWQPASGGSGWSLTGNAGTNPATDFIGTTDGSAVSIKVNADGSGGVIHMDGTAFTYANIIEAFSIRNIAGNTEYFTVNIPTDLTTIGTGNLNLGTLGGNQGDVLTESDGSGNAIWAPVNLSLSDPTSIPEYSDNASAVIGIGAGKLYYTDVAGEYVLKISH